MVVVALIAIAGGVVSLALRDPAGTRLETRGGALAALLESARAEARASGMAARWEPHARSDDGAFPLRRPARSEPLPTHWLDAGSQRRGDRRAGVLLGPEPLIGAQRIVLRLDDQRLTLATDGIGPFVGRAPTRPPAP